MLYSLFNKLQAFKACDFIKKRLQHRCFAMNIAKCLRKTFIEQLRWLFLSETDQRNVYWLYKVSYVNCFVSSLKSKFFCRDSLRWQHLKNISKFFFQMFSCEICKIFKNTYFEEHLRTAASFHSFLLIFNR